LPNNDSPGLAMARAFGDFCLKDFGLISVPDVYYRCLTERDEFIILASDGVLFPSFILIYVIDSFSYSRPFGNLMSKKHAMFPFFCHDLDTFCITTLLSC
jgi:hypothetical protein